MSPHHWPVKWGGDAGLRALGPRVRVPDCCWVTLDKPLTLPGSLSPPRTMKGLDTMVLNPQHPMPSTWDMRQRSFLTHWESQRSPPLSFDGTDLSPSHQPRVLKSTFPDYCQLTHTGQTPLLVISTTLL